MTGVSNICYLVESFGCSGLIEGRAGMEEGGCAVPDISRVLPGCEFCRHVSKKFHKITAF